VKAAIRDEVAKGRTGRAEARTPSLQRLQRNEATRQKIVEAAARVIGRYGYAGCTIARVTSRAKIAHGTFYLHFGSQQELFESVLPTLGRNMLEKIGEAIRHSEDIIDLERHGFEANFDYLVKHPYMYRVLSEAELYCPHAFHRHLDAVVESYTRSLRRSRKGNQLASFGDEELETVATMLVGARTYMLMRFGVRSGVIRERLDDKLGTYLKIVAHGIGA
jgi:AcrR family transcriptional regulator